jgi:beta-N-acetylhexosaminidase
MSYDPNRFSIPQIAGQRLMVGFDGTFLNSDLKNLIQALGVGGVILFSQNIVDAKQLKELCAAISEFAASCGRPPLFIAIDQEGGVVTRLKAPAFLEFPGAPALQTESKASSIAAETTAQLRELGINMNMAPVLDVAPIGVKSIMAKRVFGHDPKQVAKLGAVIIAEMQKRNIIAVAKHFPGIGRTTTDSHIDLPDMDVCEDDLASFDLLPFYAAIDAGVSGIMLSHIRYTQIDPQWPASLSPQISARMLRNRMGFNGVILTDDLDMGAIKNHYDIQTAIDQILTADADIALICHKGPNIETAWEQMIKKFTDDKKLKDRADASVKRIMALKKRYIRV